MDSRLRGNDAFFYFGMSRLQASQAAGGEVARRASATVFSPLLLCAKPQIASHGRLAGAESGPGLFRGENP
jgi:hypothetical protein